MNGKLDEISGKVKEAAGDALNDTKLKAEGLLQQGVGKAKEAAAELEGKANEALEKGKAEAERLAGEAKESRRLPQRSQKQILNPAKMPKAV